MHRRDFALTSFQALTIAALGRRTSFPWRAPFRVNGDRVNTHLAELSQFGRNAFGGVSRVAYSDADIAARAWVKQVLMPGAQLDASIDFAGNIVGRRAGSDPSLKPIVIGSHIDSVPEGGNYDGDVGSMSAIEVAQSLAEQHITLRHPLEVAIWTNEEGGLYGSRAVSGQLKPAELSNHSVSGKTVSEGIVAIGGDPSRIDGVRRAKGDVAAYLELHIEQGGTLEHDGIQVGVVEGIVGIQEWDVTVTGFANHAGTTPMDQRHDALLAAARFIQMANQTVRSVPGRQVENVGRIQAFPGAPNVIPGRVVLALELRDLDDAKIAMLYDRIVEGSKAIATELGVTFDFHQLSIENAAPSTPWVRDLIQSAATALGLSTKRLPSGAGHDAQAMATLGPMGMIFVPSIGGISHSPKEFTRPEDVVNGANVLLNSLIALDARV
jgi:N-carbamoyl-L-amino-acid hydrolase